MKKKAIITVKSNTIEDKENAIEVVSIGCMEKFKDGFKLEYEETEVSGMEGTNTIIYIYDNKFSLVREGTTETTMDFEGGKQNAVLYKTPYGIINLATVTRELVIDMGEDGGKVECTYLLIADDNQISTTNICIEVKVSR